MKNLREGDVIRLMREEWYKKLNTIMEGVAVKFEDLSTETKVVHKDSGIRYTVTKLGRDEAQLKTPEGKEFIVDKSTMEKSYEIG